MQFTDRLWGNPQPVFCLRRKTRLGLLAVVKTNTSWWWSLVGIALSVALPLAALAQNGNADQANPTPTATPKKSSGRASADAHQTGKSDPEKARRETELQRAYKPLVNLDDTNEIKKRSFTLIPPSLKANDSNHTLDKVILGDSDGAIAKYDRLIAESPRNSNAYCRRAALKAGKGDTEGSLADCDLAIKFDPLMAEAYNLRAFLKGKQGDFAGALTDVNQAVAIVPDLPRYRLYRCTIREENGDAEGALADASHVLEIDPLSAGAYECRGVANSVLGRWADALLDFQPNKLHPQSRNYVHLWIWISRTKLGEKGAADKELADYLNGRPPDDKDWPATVGSYLLGRGTEADLFAAVSTDPKKNSDQRCEAWFYSGMKQLISGDRTAAAEHFRECIATGQQTFVEFWIASAELRHSIP